MIDRRLPIYRPMQDSPHDICVKDTLIEECVSRYAIRRAGDNLKKPDVHTLYNLRSAEHDADGRIRRLWRELPE